MPQLPAEGAKGVLCSFSKSLQLQSPRSCPPGTRGSLTDSQAIAHPASHYQAWSRVCVFEESTPSPTHHSQQPQYREEERKKPRRGEVPKRDLIGIGALGRVPLIKGMPPWPVPPSIKAHHMGCHTSLFSLGSPSILTHHTDSMDGLHCTLEEINEQELGEQQELKETEMPELDADPHLQLLSRSAWPLLGPTRPPRLSESGRP